MYDMQLEDTKKLLVVKDGKLKGVYNDFASLPSKEGEFIDCELFAIEIKKIEGFDR